MTWKDALVDALVGLLSATAAAAWVLAGFMTLFFGHLLGVVVWGVTTVATVAFILLSQWGSRRERARN